MSGHNVHVPVHHTFCRNLPFDADEGEVMDAFRAFGGIRYCRLTRDPRTEMCKGMAALD